MSFNPFGTDRLLHSSAWVQPPPVPFPSLPFPSPFISCLIVRLLTHHHSRECQSGCPSVHLCSLLFICYPLALPSTGPDHLNASTRLNLDSNPLPITITPSLDATLFLIQIRLPSNVLTTLWRTNGTRWLELVCKLVPNAQRLVRHRTVVPSAQTGTFGSSAIFLPLPR
ncbi:hypothetical protein LY76DRAFT_76476 [Colletotrichum caudatum]|nr:hypothetical protein LY76DRAFT_76476 [Colletotrichum caudatum]